MAFDVTNDLKVEERGQTPADLDKCLNHSRVASGGKNRGQTRLTPIFLRRVMTGQFEAVFFLVLLVTFGFCATEDEVYTSSVVGSTAIPWGRPSTWITSRILPSFKIATAPALT